MLELVLDPLLDPLTWFPQQYTRQFYVAKGVLGTIGVCLLIFHMNSKWNKGIESLGQRMRYYTLLAFSVLVTGASAEQVVEMAKISYRNIGAMVCTILLLVTLAISIREEHSKRKINRQKGT